MIASLTRRITLVSEAMLKLKKHHTIVLTIVIVALVAWALWSFVWLPRSETPDLPVAPAAPITK
jgi:hypothetical protein